MGVAASFYIIVALIVSTRKHAVESYPWQQKIDAETNPDILVVSGNQISGVKTRGAVHTPFVPSATDSRHYAFGASRIVSLEAISRRKPVICKHRRLSLE